MLCRFKVSYCRPFVKIFLEIKAKKFRPAPAGCLLQDGMNINGSLFFNGCHGINAFPAKCENGHSAGLHYDIYILGRTCAHAGEFIIYRDGNIAVHYACLHVAVHASDNKCLFAAYT